MIKCETEYPLDIVRDGCSYFYSPALQLAKKITGDREKYRITYQEQWLSADIFAQEFLRKVSWFGSEQLGEKTKIAFLQYDANNDRITYCDLCNIKPGQFLKLDYAIVKNLRDSDLIQVKTIERDVRHKAWIIYKISKLKLQESNYQIEPGIYGDSLIVAKSLFIRIVGSLVKTKKGKSKK